MKKELLLFLTSDYPESRINKDLINNKYNLFDNVKLLNENDLDNYIKKIIINIKKKYNKKLNYKYQNRGYGYWIWKPYLILQELNKLNNGDILVYLDTHCILDNIKDKFNKILNYLKYSQKPLIIAKLGFNDYMYTTTKLRKVVEYELKHKFTENELNAPQYEAGIIFIKKNKFTLNFFTQYFNIMLNHIDVMTDIYNNDNDNHESFIENRHDQSLCSLLAKYYKITNLDIWWNQLH